MNDPTTTGSRRKAGTVLMYFAVFVLVLSAGLKLAHATPIVRQLALLGFAGSRLILVAFLELACALLFVIPATRSGGLLLVSSYMGGAIAVHVGHGELPVQPALILTLVWLAAWLRHPEVLWSLSQHSERAAPSVDHSSTHSALQTLNHATVSQAASAAGQLQNNR